MSGDAVGQWFEYWKRPDRVMQGNGGGCRRRRKEAGRGLGEEWWGLVSTAVPIVAGTIRDMKRVGSIWVWLARYGLVEEVAVCWEVVRTGGSQMCY